MVLGSGPKVLSTRSKLMIGNKCNIWTEYNDSTGDHRIDILGRTMISLTDKDKLPKNDYNIVLEGDNWIGTNSTILKGVTIGYGAVVAARAVATEGVPQFSIMGKVSARVLKMRLENLFRNQNKMELSDNRVSFGVL